MDTNDNRRTVALPGVCAKVKLPQLPNFLQPVTGGESIPIGALFREDVLALGLAMHRALVEHWAERFASRQKLAEREAETIGAELIHPAIVERMAMAQAGREGYPWASLTADTRTERIERMRTTLTDFAQELTRYG